MKKIAKITALATLFTLVSCNHFDNGTNFKTGEKWLFTHEVECTSFRHEITKNGTTRTDEKIESESGIFYKNTTENDNPFYIIHKNSKEKDKEAEQDSPKTDPMFMSQTNTIFFKRMEAQKIKGIYFGQNSTENKCIKTSYIDGEDTKITLGYAYYGNGDEINREDAQFYKSTDHIEDSDSVIISSKTGSRTWAYTVKIHFDDIHISDDEKYVKAELDIDYRDGEEGTEETKPTIDGHIFINYKINIYKD